MSLKQFLKQEYIDITVKQDRVRTLAQKFFDCYRTHSVFMSQNDRFSRVKFNGNTSIEISFDNELLLIVSGFGMCNHPRAKFSRVSGCGNEGNVEYKESQIENIINDLAEYEKLYPVS